MHGDRKMCIIRREITQKSNEGRNTDMRLKRLVLLILTGLFFLNSACGETLLSRDRCLEAALVMLEEDSPFIRGYREATGRKIEALCPLGCPYLWGGKAETRLLETIFAWQSSPAYYVKGQSYLYGLDCSGFIQYIMRSTGNPKVESISTLLGLPENAGYDIEGAEEKKGEELAACLQPGDLLAVCHKRGAYHVGMYIGTLAVYGYTTETLPEDLRPYLHYPLMIHCTTSGAYYERYEDYIEDLYDRKVYPPDGGVIVSVLTEGENAPYEAWTPDNDPVRYFDLNGYVLSAYDTSKDLKTRWVRWRRDDPYGTGETGPAPEEVQDINVTEETEAAEDNMEENPEDNTEESQVPEEAENGEEMEKTEENKEKKKTPSIILVTK